jgi:hypothetical protein
MTDFGQYREVNFLLSGVACPLTAKKQAAFVGGGHPNLKSNRLLNRSAETLGGQSNVLVEATL